MSGRRSGTETIGILTDMGVVPHPSPGRTSAGILLRYGDVALQFDVGRGTVLRPEEAGSSPHALSAHFVAQVHSDRLVDLVDVAITRWIQRQVHDSVWLIGGGS